MIKEITSAQNSYIKELIKLKNGKERKEQNKFLIEGEDLVELAYNNNLLDTIISTTETKYDVDTIICPKFILEKLSNNKSVPNMIGIAHYPLKNVELGNKIVYLDGVQDPGNVGTIIRTSLAFSYSSVILSSDCASKYNEKTIQSSKGSVFSIPLFENISLHELKEMGYQIIVTALHNSKDYREIKPQEKFVLVLGNEGQGVKKENIDLADDVAKIDMSNIDSLNVAVAGGILLNHYKN